MKKSVFSVLKINSRYLQSPGLNSPTFTIMNEFQIKPALEKAAEEILNRIAKWISKRSGWVIENILRFFINIVSLFLLKGDLTFLCQKN